MKTHNPNTHLSTHDVNNQPTPLGNYNLFSSAHEYSQLPVSNITISTDVGELDAILSSSILTLVFLVFFL